VLKAFESNCVCVVFVTITWHFIQTSDKLLIKQLMCHFCVTLEVNKQFSKEDYVLLGHACKTDTFEAQQVYPKRCRLVRDKVVFVCTNTSISIMGNNSDFTVVLTEHMEELCLLSCHCVCHQENFPQCWYFTECEVFVRTLCHICAVM
jgi:hypothetical protein